MRKQKGITLISLIITIILLLILVGASLGIILQGNFFYKARRTAKMAGEKIQNQDNTIEQGQNDWEQMEVDMCSHIWGEETVTLAPTCTTPGKKVIKCENCGKTMEEEMPALGHNYVNRICTRCGDVEPLVIGANINYHEYLNESGGTVTSSYTSTKVARGSTDSSDADATYSVVNNSGIQWIVLGEENGQIKITTKNIVQPTSGGYKNGNFTYLCLQGKTGYANFVDELNKISAIYGKGEYADTAKFSSSGGRSFKMEDLGYTLTRTAIYKYARHSDGKIYRYAANTTVNGTSTTGGDDTTFNYMTLDASNSTEETSSSHTWKSLPTTVNSYVTMYQYTYSGNRTLDTTVSKADKAYCLASRYLSISESSVDYCLRGVDGKGNIIEGALIYGSYDNNFDGYDYSVRPVVYLKSTAKLSNYSSTNGYTLSY